MAEDYEPYVPLKKRKIKGQSSQDFYPNLPKATIVSGEGYMGCLPEHTAKVELPIKKISNEYRKDNEVKFYVQNFKNVLKTSWTPPTYCFELTPDKIKIIREKFNIKVEGCDIPCPLTSYKEMKLHRLIVKSLKRKNIKAPTPIQIQGLPVVLSGRDIVGISFTGSGKTLVFVLPMIIFSLEQEIKMPLKNSEGPFALILVPSRELARQIYDNIEYFCKYISDGGFPLLKNHLCIGGVPLREQIESVRKGCHILIATPGRLIDLINKNIVDLSICRMLCIDEADRMFDVGFDHELKTILDSFKFQRQTMVFSSTIPSKINDIIDRVLVKPIIITVEKGNASSLNITQEIELVSEESKLQNLLRYIRRTPPPVLIFAYKKIDVDNIYDYLKSKEVDVVAIHGDNDQKDRHKSLVSFMEGSVDIMVATDIASKGLDFPLIKHVINYDLPSEINAYIRRIGQTGRGGRTGLSTTFVTKSCDETILVELRNLLVESKQKIPQFLLDLKFESGFNPSKPLHQCLECGLKGHLESNCPKVDRKNRNLPKSDCVSGTDLVDW